MIDKNKLNDVERDLVEGLEQFLRDLKADAPFDAPVSGKKRAKLTDASDTRKEQRPA